MMEEEQKNKMIEVFEYFHPKKQKMFTPRIEGISQSDFFLLHHLMRCLEFKKEMQEEKTGERLGVQVTVLSMAAGMSKPAVSQALNSLEDRKLVERFTAKGDRRAVFVTLTEKGDAVMAEGWRIFLQYMDRVEEEMGEENTLKLVELSKRFAAIMENVREEFELKE